VITGKVREEKYLYFVQLLLMKKYLADECKRINVSMKAEL